MTASVPSPHPRIRDAAAVAASALLAFLYARGGAAWPLGFVVLAPWYRSWWALGFYLLLVVAAVRAYAELRGRTLQRRAAKLESQVAVQTEELRHTVQTLRQTFPHVSMLSAVIPAWPRMWAIILTAVVFPFVPVTETTGIRAWVPGG